MIWLASNLNDRVNTNARKMLQQVSIIIKQQYAKGFELNAGEHSEAFRAFRSLHNKVKSEQHIIRGVSGHADVVKGKSTQSHLVIQLRSDKFKNNKVLPYLKSIHTTVQDFMIMKSIPLATEV